MAAALLVLPSCSTEPVAALRRLALLPGNILIPDPASEWMRFAVPLVLQQDLSVSRSLVTTIAESDSGAYQFGASELLEATVENRYQRLHIQATITDLGTQRSREVFTVDRPA
ncbi:MAG: hypothetical protein JOZ62_21765, partial [Acidobacteriaceae bacterium]|nr:hypothetical protein [Acidobacteriaceae bacterium]